MKEVSQDIKDVIDDLVLNAQGFELTEMFHWVDAQAFKNNRSFYEEAILHIQKYSANKKAREWNLSRA